MTPEQVTLVQDSFRAVVPIKEQAAALFYGRLFEIAPEVKPLFAKTDIVEQGAKLMATLAFVVGGLKRPEEVIGPAQALAKRHVGYGVEAAHYAAVGAALLWTLEQGLGAGFTPPVKEAWTAAYVLLSGVMIEAAAAP
jgi:nitric oxide dioxygenase